MNGRRVCAPGRSERQVWQIHSWTKPLLSCLHGGSLNSTSLHWEVLERDTYRQSQSDAEEASEHQGELQHGCCQRTQWQQHHQKNYDCSGANQRSLQSKEKLLVLTLQSLSVLGVRPRCLRRVLCWWSDCWTSYIYMCRQAAGHLIIKQQDYVGFKCWEIFHLQILGNGKGSGMHATPDRHGMEACKQ